MPQLQAIAERVQDSELAALFDSLGTRAAWARGSEIFGQDEPAEGVYLVIAGTVRTTRLLADGRRQIGSFHQAGDVFGLETGTVHRFSAEALGHCTLAVIRRSVLSRPEGAEALQRVLWIATARELERTQEHMLLLGRKSACERVAAFLAGLAARAAGAVELPPLFELPMSRQDMADYLGLTIETVSRMLTQLQAGRLIRLIGPRKLEVSRLAELVRLGEGAEDLRFAA